MSRKTDGQAKYYRKFTPTQTGILRKIEEEKVFSINILRVSINGEATLQVKGKTLNEEAFTTLATITSTTTISDTVDISTWDYVEYEVTSISGTPTICVSGFFEIMAPFKEIQMGRDYDTINVTYPNSSTEQYQYQLGGATIRTVQITYTDSTKAELQTVELI